MNFSVFQAACCYERLIILRNLQLNTCRNFSLSAPLALKTKKRYAIKKYPHIRDASRSDRYNRSDQQRLMNFALKKIPFDSSYEVTAKHTGPQNPGGTVEAARLTALHLVEKRGYTSLSGKFMKVKEMSPELVVPDLTDFNLQPYVPYIVSDIQQPQLTAKDMYKLLYAQKARVKVIEERKEKEKQLLKAEEK